MKRSMESIRCLLALLGVGCIHFFPEDINPDLASLSQSIPLLSKREIGTREYTKVGNVEGLSCAVMQGSRPSMAEAETRMRIAALQQKADAIIGERCAEGGTDWSNNCLNTIKCRGDAIRWTEKGSAGTAAKIKQARGLYLAGRAGVAMNLVLQTLNGCESG